MNDQLVRDLLHEVADDVEPGDRLGAIRAATAPTGRRTPRGWWVAGGAGLLAASVVTALVLTVGAGPRGDGADPAGPGPVTATGPSCCEVLPVYFVGDTPAGPRLYREFQRSTAPAATFALAAALRGDSLDPDYRSTWPADAAIGSYAMADDLLTVSLEGDVHDLPDGASASDARLAIEQLVRTAQGIFGEGRVPVRLLVDDQPTDTVLGVPTSEPLGNAPDEDVLAQVSISDPSEGQVVDNDAEFLHVRGRARGSGPLEIEIVSAGGQSGLGTGELRGLLRPDRFTEFEPGFSLADAEPGAYDVIVTARGGDGVTYTDTRRITIVD